jgi:hypothetical protein
MMRVAAALDDPQLARDRGLVHLARPGTPEEPRRGVGGVLGDTGSVADAPLDIFGVTAAGYRAEGIAEQVADVAGDPAR